MIKSCYNISQTLPPGRFDKLCNRVIKGVSAHYCCSSDDFCSQNDKIKEILSKKGATIINFLLFYFF